MIAHPVPALLRPQCLMTLSTRPLWRGNMGAYRWKTLLRRENRLIHSYHRIHECCQSCLLRGCQAIPFIQHLTLCGSQSHTNVVLRKELRQCNTESIADLLKRCKRWRHRFFIPRGDGRLWQARAFSKLIFRPSPCLTISFDDFQNICHNFTT